MITREEFFLLGHIRANNVWQHPDEPVDHRHEVYFWWAQQHQEELWSLIDAAQQNGCKTVLEIGANHGGNWPFWDQMVGPGGKVVGVELDSSYAYSICKASDYRMQANVAMLVGDSHTKTMRDEVMVSLGDNQVDLLFIDGDHSYDGARNDYQVFSPFVRKGGIIAFHDVAIDPRVTQFFDELPFAPSRKKILPVHYQGIGLIYKT